MFRWKRYMNIFQWGQCKSTSNVSRVNNPDPGAYMSYVRSEACKHVYPRATKPDSQGRRKIKIQKLFCEILNLEFRDSQENILSCCFEPIYNFTIRIMQILSDLVFKISIVPITKPLAYKKRLWPDKNIIDFFNCNP